MCRGPKLGWHLAVGRGADRGRAGAEAKPVVLRRPCQHQPKFTGDSHAIMVFTLAYLLPEHFLAAPVGKPPPAPPLGP